MAELQNIKKVLVANRGEIAVRIIRACRELGIQTVAVYSDVDRESLHVRYADEVYHIGPPQPGESYLRIDKLIDVAKKSGADAVHPGYGFLSERAAFAEATIDAGLTWIGPHPYAIRVMGNKEEARETVRKAGVPVVPGTHPGLTDEEIIKAIHQDIGFPVLIKAAAGGGGKGMRVVRKPDELLSSMAAAHREALGAFGDGTIYAEKLVDGARHIEFQILADMHGNTIHLLERECSIQRRHQKLVEEAPSPIMDEDLRARMGEMAVKAAQSVNYVNAGTIECLVDKDKNFYFLEMNTRIQVEHPVTEMITDIDLVLEQIRVAAGGDLPCRQEDLRFHGHAIECRVNAENPATFRPSPGKILHYHPPGGLGVRVDSAAYQGYTIPPYYDSMVGKLIVHGKTRQECLMRLKRALDEFVVDGVETTLPLFRTLVRNPDIIDGNYSIHWLEKFLAEGGMDS